MSVTMNTPTSGNRLLWISLMVFGMVGLSLNAFARKDGMAHGYVEVKEVERVQVTVVQSAGAGAASADAELKWVAPTDPKIASGEYTRVAGVAPRAWTVESLVPAKEAAMMMTARDAGDLTVERVEPSAINTFGIWIAAFLTLGIFSFLYRDNPWYKVAESVLIGVSAAYWMINAFWSTLVPNLFGALAPTLVRAVASPNLPVSSSPNSDFWLAVVPLILGFMLLWRLAPKGGWISIWPIAFIIGTTAGLKLVSGIEADLMAQAVATMQPLVVLNPADSATATASSFSFSAISFWGSIGSVVSVVGVLSVLTYFFFSLEHKGAVGKTARVGVWFLMITFGSAFGLTVMGRITLLAQRFEFLFTDWLNIG
jgi:hypothetical protein